MTEQNNNTDLAADEIAKELGLTITEEQRASWRPVEIEERIRERVREKEREACRQKVRDKDVANMTQVEFDRYTSQLGF
jgi:hypothetical protein